MPVKIVKKNGRVIGYRWGNSGKLYTVSKYGSNAKVLADRQARAIYASGYVSKKRSRPKQHVRRLRNGKRVLVNKGVKKKRNYGMAWAIDSGIPVADHPKSFGYEGELVEMDPDEFLEVTRQEAIGRIKQPRKGEEYVFDKNKYERVILNKDNVAKLANKIKSKSIKVDQPYLEFNEEGVPVGHEGRHRAAAARSLGYKTIPVRIVRKPKLIMEELK